MLHIGLVHPMIYLKAIFDGLTVFPIHFPTGSPAGQSIAITINSRMMTVLKIYNIFHKNEYLLLIEYNLGLSSKSNQDCVELRRYFRIPPAIQAKTKIVPVTLTYMWNDRDCNEKNFFLCERPLSDGNQLC